MRRTLHKGMNNHDSVLFTGGLGDIIALTSYMSLEYRQSIKTIHWAAFRGNALKPLFSKLKDFKKVEHNVLHDDFSDLKALYSKKDVENRCNVDLKDVEDWSISAKFPEIKEGKWKYEGCPFLESKLASVPKDLPRFYVVIQGATPMNQPEHQQLRNLLPFEWQAIDRDLKKMGLVGVVLDVPGKPLPITSDRLQDRRGLSLGASIEVLKDPRCVGYWGIDSFLSILATRRFKTEPDALKIRSRNPHYWRWQSIYAAPYGFFPFATKEMR